ncbi:MAG: alcohol dehydrogenase catalytic domain-containing protein [Armatimonadota bacterium]|nr:alcohol dehydrogenase catalytic domain-containing protein [Armatimonadota bacterium]
MLAVVKERPGPGFVLKDVPVPEPPPGWVRVRVRAAGICGSDLPIFNGIRPVPTPLIPGHEVAGDVDRVGEGVLGFRPGERVAVDLVVACGLCGPCRTAQPELCERLVELGIDANGGFAEYMVAPARNLHHIPPGLSFDKATAADPLASAYHGVEAAVIQSDDTVAVFGVGAIGLYAIQAARLRRPRRLIAVGRRDDALALAREVGADLTVDARTEDPAAAVWRITGGGASVVVEATGAPALVATACEAAGRGARVILLGVYHGAAAIAPGPIVRRELRVLGRLCYTWGEYEHCLGLLASGQVRPLISHRMALSEMSQALGLIHQRRTIKIVVHP